MHFIEHLASVTEKSPRMHDENLRKLEPQIRRLKNKIGFLDELSIT
jgi:hypothetical protein